MKWRVVKLSDYNAFMNMAMDEAVSEAVAEKKSLPTIRFYTWNPSAVSIGYFQSLEQEVNVEKCEELGVDVVRRRTGGGAVYHDDKGEITYSVIAPENIMPKGIIESYHVICGWIVDSLKRINIESEFKPINDIITNGKKISGNAQTRRNNIVLQHGTILYDLDVEKMFTVLKVGIEKISDKVIQSVKERVTSVLDQKKIEREELHKALIDGFTAGKDFEFSDFNQEEIKRAEELVKEKYETREWNYMR